VLIEGNVIDNTWADAQVGYAILFKATNQDGGAPWSTTQDVTMRYNKIWRVAAAWNIAAHPEQYPVTSPAARFLIYDNVVDSVNVGQFTGPGVGLQVLGDVADLIFAHNTTTNPSGNQAVLFDGFPNTRFVYHSNLTSAGAYGIFGSAWGDGTPAINHYAPSALYANIALVGNLNCSRYPATTLCLAAWPTVYPAGFDGRVVGADTVQVNAHTANAVVAP
jgi:hypothetical protein